MVFMYTLVSVDQPEQSVRSSECVYYIHFSEDAMCLLSTELTRLERTIPKLDYWRKVESTHLLGLCAQGLVVIFRSIHFQTP